jgi:hypothetical protein
MSIPKVSGKKAAIPIILILVVLIVIGGLLFYRNQKTSTSAANEVGDLSMKVGKLIELPSETPTVATVSDINKLKDQPFFARAQNGDKVLIYQNANKAILYRPSTNKIVEVAYYNPAKASVTPTAASEKIRVAIYNGTKTEGLAKTQGATLTSKYPNIVINDTANASGDYEKTVVVDITGKNAAFVKTLAQDLSGEVKSMPSVEARPDADVLIILGE